MIRFYCTKCKKIYRVPTAHAGRRALCTGCHKILIVPYPKTIEMPLNASDRILYHHFDRLEKELSISA